MDTSSLNESSSTSDTIGSITPTPKRVFNMISSAHHGLPPSGKASATAGTLSRMGSGTSVIIDSENGIETETRKLPSSKYKGVVPQPNGRWGAQIYEKHQRVWLGTFNEEDEAAQAYDVAAQRFRGRDAVTNFKPLSQEDETGAAELRFLNTRSKAEVVDMLRKHTYFDELQQSKRNYKADSSNSYNKWGDNLGSSSTCQTNKSNSCDAVGGFGREQLFEKVVTPSDVGKLNRLVIPKQHAEKHFPLQGGGGGGSETCSSTSKGVLLNFEDLNDKVWRFRYSYWNSSQSYVLTKGWSRFVKEKGLKAGDTVSFQRSAGPDRQFYIDYKRRTELGPGPGPEVLGRVEDARSTGQMLRLFGVDICQLPIPINENGKRLREVELLAMVSSSKKQQMVVTAL